MIAQHLPIFAGRRARFFIKLRGSPAAAAAPPRGGPALWIVAGRIRITL